MGERLSFAQQCDRIFEGVPIYGGGGRRYFFSDKYANLALLFFLTNLTLYDLTIILYDSTVINVTLYVYIIFFIKYVVPLPPSNEMHTYLLDL